MPIQVTCECGTRLCVADEDAGTEVSCPQCNASLRVAPVSGEGGNHAAWDPAVEVRMFHPGVPIGS